MLAGIELKEFPTCRKLVDEYDDCDCDDRNWNCCNEIPLSCNILSSDTEMDEKALGIEDLV